MRLGNVALVVAVVGSASCFKVAEFACTSDTECVRSGVPGMCELVGYCSFPDPSCSEGRRFGDYSGAYTKQCVGQGSRTDAGADAVPDAAPGFYRIGGTVAGLTGTLALRDNGADDLTVTANGPFTFVTPLAIGSAYAVTVRTAPFNQTVSIANGGGTVGSADVTNVNVTCAAAGSDPGVRCGAMYCMGTEECCTNPLVCNSSSCSGASLSCDDFADCPASQVCCVYYNPGINKGDAICRTQAACMTYTLRDFLCDPGAPTPCPTGGTCTLLTTGELAGYHACK